MTRVLSGVAMAGVAVALVWFLTPPALLAVAMLLAALAFIEYARLVDAIGAKVPWWTALVATLGACAMVPFPWVSVEVVIGIGLIATAAIVLLSDRVGAPTLADTAAAVLAPVYIGLPLGALVAIDLVAGREAVLIADGHGRGERHARSTTRAARSAAGRWRRGGSPKKTIEGAVGGFVVAPAVLVAAGIVVAAGHRPAGASACWACCSSLAGIVGDLFESMLKRRADVKDSSHLIPGHGGVLDRIDALLFCAPVFYFCHAA